MDVYGVPEDVKQMLEPGERILVYVRPVRLPYVVKGLVVLPFLIPLLAAPLLIFLFVAGGPVPLAALLFFGVFWYPFLLLILLGVTVYPWLLWRTMHYVVTDRRVIVRKGVIGTDYDVLRLDQIQQVNLDVGFWDKKCGTGTITLQSMGVKPLSLVAVPNPREVQKIIEEAIQRVRREMYRAP